MEYDVIINIDSKYINEDLTDVEVVRYRTQTDIEAGGAKGLDPNYQMSYGNRLRTSLSLGNNYDVDVIDFGMQLVTKVTYHNIGTGQSASQTFLINMINKKGGGFVKSSSARYRSCSSFEQAVNYIRTRVTGLQNKTTSI